MGRTSGTIGDDTPLDSLVFDIPARIGWLLRISRMCANVSVREMADRLGDVGVRGVRSPGAVSQVETKGTRNGRMIDGYERALDLTPGQLRAVVDILCRTFSYAPADVAPGLDLHDPLREVDEAFAAVEHDPSGSDWLRLARLLDSSTATPLPTRLVAPMVERMLGELVRSVGPAFYLRWDALARLQDGFYADVVLDGVQDLVAQPGAHAVSTVALSLTSERPRTRTLEWLVGLFDHPSYEMFRGAVVGVGNMRHVGGLSDRDWELVITPFLEAHSRWGRGPRGELLTALFKSLPPSCRSVVEGRLEHPLRPVRGPASWDPTDNEHWTLCESLADRAAAQHGLPSQPLLARMIFEALYDFRSNVTTSSWLLSVTELAPTLHAGLLAVVNDPPDEESKAGALRCVFTSATPASDQVASAWYGRMPVEGRIEHLGMAEQFALLVPQLALPLLTDGSGRGSELIRALGSAGQMAELTAITTDPLVPEELRLSASWWLAHGARVSR